LETVLIDSNKESGQEIKQSTQSKKESPKMANKWEWDLMALLTGLLALFACASFIVLWIQANDARESFAKDQRPYVWVIAKGPFEPPKIVPSGEMVGRMVIQFNFTNYGKSPAIRVRPDAHIAIGEDAWKEVAFNKIYNPQGSILPTGVEMSNFAYTNKQLEQNEWQQILSGQLPYIIFGHIEYTDMSGKTDYTSEFCSVGRMEPAGIPTHLASQEQHGVCKEHNSVN
jgi:hypothetical protein